MAVNYTNGEIIPPIRVKAFYARLSRSISQFQMSSHTKNDNKLPLKNFIKEL